MDGKMDSSKVAETEDGEELEMEQNGACQRPPPGHAYLKLIDVLLDKPRIWRLSRNYLYTIGVEPACDIVLPMYGYKTLPTGDSRLFTTFTIRYVESNGHWWIERMFDQVQFHPSIEKRWLRTAKPDGHPEMEEAPEGLVMCILNPNGSAMLQHGDVFEFKACATPPYMPTRFEFLFWPESPRTNAELAEDLEKFPLLDLPDLALAKVASHLNPEEFFSTLHMASPSLGSRLRHSIDWRDVTYDDTLDNIRLARMTSPSEVRSAFLGDVPKENEVNFPDLFESMLKVFTGNKLTKLRVLHVENLLLYPLPRSLKTIAFEPDPSETANWKTIFNTVDFPATIDCVKFVCNRADAPAYDLRARVFDKFPKVTKFLFYPSPSELFWDDVTDEALVDITHFHVRLDLGSEFPIDRLDSMKELLVCTIDPLVLAEDGFYFTMCPNLEGLCINLMVLGESGTEEFWTSLKERAPKLTYMKIMTMPGELIAGPKTGALTCDDKFINETFLEYWPGVTILILEDCLISVATILRLIRVAKTLQYLEVSTTTPMAFIPPSIRNVPGETIKVKWFQPPPSEEDLEPLPELTFIFTTLPRNEVKRIGRLFEI